MGFQRGDEVEVCSKQEGFIGSYFAATVIAKLDDQNLYRVVYKDLVEEDESTPLTETVTCDEVRPVPPKTTEFETRFCTDDEVDAFDNDGWWVGTITEEKEDRFHENNEPMYYVYFATYCQKIAYPVSKLRLHLEWANGN